MAEQFCSLFPKRDAFIWKLPDDGEWRRASGPLRNNQILGVVSDEGRGLFRGTYWSYKTRHAVLDIDAGSNYHQAAELLELAEKLAAVGLSAKPYQSSASGGWHVYLFFDDWQDCGQVEQTLKSWLKGQGYSIECGQLEVFPSGNALRLPLQKGFGWLDLSGNLVRRREEITEEEALASFLCDLEDNKRSWSEAKRRIDSQLNDALDAAGAGVQAHRKAIDTEGFDELWTGGRIEERIEEARHYLDNGLTEAGSRHAAVYAIQHLLWFGDRARGVPRLPGAQNNEKRARFVKEWLEKNHNGHCRHINSGNWREVEEHIRRACQWRRQDHQTVTEYTPYMETERSLEAKIGLWKKTRRVWTQEDLDQANQKREEKAREKIRLTAEEFSKQGRKATIRGLAKASGCDRHTVRRHSHIWSAPSVVLSKGGGHLDPGGVGGTGSLGSSVLCSNERDFYTSEIEVDTRTAVDGTEAPMLPAVEEERLLPPACEGDSGQADLSCLPSVTEGDVCDLEPAALLRSAEAPPIPPLAAALLRLGAASAWCLLACADRLVAKARESDGMVMPGFFASPSRTQPSTGSKHRLGGSSIGTCGLNGSLPSGAVPPLGPLHLNPREIFCKGSDSVLLQDGGGRSGGRAAPVVLVAVGLFVIWQPNRRTGKQTRGLDVTWISGQARQLEGSIHEPTASAPESSSTDSAHQARLCGREHKGRVLSKRAHPARRQSLGKHFWITPEALARGPPREGKPH